MNSKSSKSSKSSKFALKIGLALVAVSWMACGVQELKNHQVDHQHTLGKADSGDLVKVIKSTLRIGQDPHAACGDFFLAVEVEFSQGVYGRNDKQVDLTPRAVELNKIYVSNHSRAYLDSIHKLTPSRYVLFFSLDGSAQTPSNIGIAFNFKGSEVFDAAGRAIAGLKVKAETTSMEQISLAQDQCQMLLPAAKVLVENETSVDRAELVLENMHLPFWNYIGRTSRRDVAEALLRNRLLEKHIWSKGRPLLDGFKPLWDSLQYFILIGQLRDARAQKDIEFSLDQRTPRFWKTLSKSGKTEAVDILWAKRFEDGLDEKVEWSGYRLNLVQRALRFAKVNDAIYYGEDLVSVLKPHLDDALGYGYSSSSAERAVAEAVKRGGTGSHGAYQTLEELERVYWRAISKNWDGR